MPPIDLDNIELNVLSAEQVNDIKKKKNGRRSRRHNPGSGRNSVSIGRHKDE